MESPSEVKVELATEFPPEPTRELAPYPGGDMPIDGRNSPQPHWDNRRWVVWQQLHEGKTSTQAAKASGYSMESVRKLRKQWKERYGINITARQWTDCLTDPRYARPVSKEEVQDGVNQEHLVVGNQARRLVQTWLAGFMGETDEAKARRGKLTATEVAKIQEIGLLADRAAAGVLEPPAKGKGTSAPAPTTGAQKAVGALGKAPRRGPKGKQADDAGAIVVGLRQALGQFRDSGAEEAG